MVTRKRGLGRGLNALLGGEPDLDPARKSATPDAAGKPEAAADRRLDKPLGSGEQLLHLPVGTLRSGRHQPRQGMDADRLEELAVSIRTNGMMQPITVRPLPTDRGYEIIAGERRWQAAQLAGLKTVPVIVRPVSDEAAMKLALIENIQREDLSPLEEATALKRLLDEFGLTQQEVANNVGKSRATITNLLRLLTLTGEVRELLERGVLDMGHARALLTLKEADQLRIARMVADRGLTVRETEALARAAAGEGTSTRKKAVSTKTDPDTARLERSLSDQVGAPVSIRQRNGGAGQLVIRYSSLDELQGILQHIR